MIQQLLIAPAIVSRQRASTLQHAERSQCTCVFGRLTQTQLGSLRYSGMGVGPHRSHLLRMTHLPLAFEELNVTLTAAQANVGADQS